MEQQVARHSACPINSLPVYDDIVIGAGGAGMHLLYAMYQQGYLAKSHVLVVEPLAKNSNDRTWCFWAREHDPIVQHLGHLATHSWDTQWAGPRLQTMSPYRYYHFRSVDFYAYVRKLLSENAQITWVQQAVESLENDQDVFAVSTKEKIFYGRRVFDSRIPKASADMLHKNRIVWQSFTGWRVKFTSPLPYAHAIRLMDFEVPQQGATQFMYVLPATSGEALIELTRFGEKLLTEEEAQPVLEAYITKHFGHSYQILEKETGKIPMTLAFNPPFPYHPETARYIPIGTAAGAVKATTGYAFKNMHAHAQGLVEALIKGTPFPTPYQNRRFTFYDTLLLHILVNTPSAGKTIFTQLFKKVSPGKVYKFLDGHTTLPEEIPLLLSLPFRTFIKAFWKVYVERSGGFWVRQKANTAYRPVAVH
jgi:lycopene beta-cyclase